MRTPRSVYIVISRAARLSIGYDFADFVRVFPSLAAAKEYAGRMNAGFAAGVDDWRPEKYNKGD